MLMLAQPVERRRFLQPTFHRRAFLANQ